MAVGKIYVQRSEEESQRSGRRKKTEHITNGV